jgi:predicted phage terminase large subunit-like protein
MMLDTPLDRWVFIVGHRLDGLCRRAKALHRGAVQRSARGESPLDRVKIKRSMVYMRYMYGIGSTGTNLINTAQSDREQEIVEGIISRRTPWGVPGAIRGTITRKDMTKGTYDIIRRFKRTERALNDTGYFAKRYFGMDLYGNQIEWDKYFNDHQKALLEAPVGHAKSHLVAFMKILQEICRDRRVRILYGTETARLAEDNIIRIGHQLRYNIKIVEDFGVFYDRHNKWTGDRLEVLGSEKMFKEPTIIGVGLGGAIEGARFTLGVLDDPIDLKSMNSEAERRKAKQWYDNTFYPRLEPDARVWIIGSAWHQDDLYVHIAKKPGMASKTYIAITDDSKQTVLCPERWSYARLMEQRAHMGSAAFNLRFMNDRKAKEGTTFKDDWLRYYDTVDETFLKIYQGWDLAISERDEAHYTACATIGISKDNFIYVLDMIRKRMMFPEQLKMVGEQARRYRNFMKAGIESVSYQRALAQHSRHTDLFLAGKVVDVPVTKDKPSKMSAFSVYFENGRVFLKRSARWLETFKSEYLSYPYGKHADQLDALEIAVQLALKGSRRVRRSALR